MAKRFLFLIALVMLGFYIAGCAEGDSPTTVTNPNPNVFSPTGSISGMVFDGCLGVQVKGAKISVANKNVTTGAGGTFMIDRLPANDSDDDAYLVVCDLTTTLIPGQTTEKYGYSLIQEAFVEYNDLGDGTNPGGGFDGYDGGVDFEESGSGASTPVDKLNVSVDFTVAAANSEIHGIVWDVSSNRVEAAGATVTLWRVFDLGDDQTFYQSVETSPATDSTGAFEFLNLIPAFDFDYAISASKAGYVFAAYQPDINAADTCGRATLKCSLGCNQVLENLNANIWKNPDKDQTIPYIAEIDADTTLNLLDGEHVASEVQAFVVSFSEAMLKVDSFSLKADPIAISLTDDFSVTVTSAGPIASRSADNPHTFSPFILTDVMYAAEWNEAGTVLTLTPDYKTPAALLAESNTDKGGTAWLLANVTFAYSGAYTIAFANQNPKLADANNILWDIVDYPIPATFFLSPGNGDPSAFFQNNFILGGGSSKDIEINADF